MTSTMMMMLTTTTTTKNVTGSYCSPDLGSKIFLSMCPLLLGFGTCTNIFSLLVLSRKRMRKHSTYVYLAILSVIDLLALWLGLVRDYLSHGYGITIQSSWLCKLHSFLFYYTLDFSSWILVAVSIDRFVAITFVFSSYTRQLLLKVLAKPRLICCIIGCCLMLLNLHFVFYVEAQSKPSHHSTSAATGDISTTTTSTTTTTTAERLRANEIRLSDVPQRSLDYSYSQHYLNMNNNNHFHTIGVSVEYLNCIIDVNKHPGYVKFFLNVWPYIDLSAYAILPFCFMFICNIAIIKNAKFSTSSSSFGLNGSLVHGRHGGATTTAAGSMSGGAGGGGGVRASRFDNFRAKLFGHGSKENSSSTSAATSNSAGGDPANRRLCGWPCCRGNLNSASSLDNFRMKKKRGSSLCSTNTNPNQPNNSGGSSSNNNNQRSETKRSFKHGKRSKKYELAVQDDASLMSKAHLAIAASSVGLNSTASGDNCGQSTGGLSASINNSINNINTLANSDANMADMMNENNNDATSAIFEPNSKPPKKVKKRAKSLRNRWAASLGLASGGAGAGEMATSPSSSSFNRNANSKHMTSLLLSGSSNTNALISTAHYQ